MKKAILFFSLFAVTGAVMAQKLVTTSAVISFDATTPKDALPKAENKTVIASYDKTSGALMFEAAVNNFAFSNAMIQKHFNDAKWLNSAEYPKFTFSGNVNKPEKIKFEKDGTYDVEVKGVLTIKDVSKEIETPATVTISGGKVTANSTFSIKLKDYNVNGQAIEAGKVAEKPAITVTASFN